MLQALECRKEEAKKACVQKGLEVAATEAARQALVRALSYCCHPPMLATAGSLCRPRALLQLLHFPLPGVWCTSGLLQSLSNAASRVAHMQFLSCSLWRLACAEESD